MLAGSCLKKAVALCAVLMLPGSAVAKEQICITCHSAPRLATEREGRVVSLYVDEKRYQQSVHARLNCTDCHADLRGTKIPHEPVSAAVDCASCHRPGGPAPAGGANLYPDSIHGRQRAAGNKKAPTCSSCHSAHYALPPTNPRSEVYRQNLPETCGKCHKEGEYYLRSIHGRLLLKGTSSQKVPVCTDCHGVHNIQPTTAAGSLTQKQHIPETCGRCHPAVEKKYWESIHGQALKQGKLDAPACTDCHGEHEILPPTERASRVSPAHVVRTCSACHESVLIQRRYGLPANRLASYAGSYHGLAHRLGEVTVANCASCHGAHAILPSTDPRSSIYPANIPKTCGKCHPRASANFAKGHVHLWPSPRNDRAVFWVRTAYQAFVFGLVAVFCLYIALDLVTRGRKGRDYMRGGRDG